MKIEDILELEYKQMYDQYRWIGQQQTTVLTLYGAVSAVIGAILVGLKPTVLASDSHYFLLIGISLLGIGILGIGLGCGIFLSRIMQRRTGQYITSLLANLVLQSENTTLLGHSALCLRNLCTTGSDFSMLDTMNISIVLTIYTGETFAVGGVIVLLIKNLYFDIFPVIITGTVVLFWVWVISWCELQRKMRKHLAKIDADCEVIIKSGIGVQDLLKTLGLPEGMADRLRK